MLVLPINFFAFIYIFFNVLRCILDYFVFSSLYNLVEVRRVELLTSCLQGRRSSQTELYPQIFTSFQCTVSTLKNKQ